MDLHTTLLGAGLALGISATAPADVVVSVWNGALDFHFKRSHMPDFDQRRDDCCGSPGLPNDGAMYCVPTATMNLFGYAANHAFASFAPGAGNWQSNLLYDEATDAITELGTYMGTTGAGGTGGVGWSHGTYEWLSLYSSGLLTRTATFVEVNNDPDVLGMALKNFAGGIVAFSYGRYNLAGTYNGWPLLGTRTGGHIVTFVEAKRNESTHTLRYRDPADSPADAMQSTFASKEVNWTHTKVAYFADDDWIKWVDILEDPDAGDQLYIIDGYVTVQPLSFLSFTNTGPQFFLDQVAPLHFDPPAPGPMPMGQITGVQDLDFEIDGGAHGLALVNVSSIGYLPKLRRFNLVDGTYADVPVAEPLKRFVTGRDGRIYGHDGSKLYRFRPDGSLDGATSNIPTPTALAYDDVNDHIIVLSIPQRIVRRLTSSFATVSTFLVPAVMEMSGDGSVIVNPLDQHVLFCTDASSQVFELSGLGPPFTSAAHSVPGLPAPKSLGAADDGKLFVSTPDGLRVLVKAPPGNWSMDATSPFHDLDITGRMANLRSRSNATAMHDGPAWNNIPPAELPDLGTPVLDCIADADGDDTVGFGDLLFLLSEWGGAAGAADVDGDGVVGFPDLLIVLASWGPCA
jgi:hypothetical protein